MKEIPDFDIELSQAVDYILGSGLARRAFAAPPFKNYVNILTELIRSIDRLADNCHMPEFTNHAMPHVLSMVKRGSEWGESDGWLEPASPKEAACLLMAMVIHDMGMVSQDSRNLPDKPVHQGAFRRAGLGAAHPYHTPGQAGEIPFGRISHRGPGAVGLSRRDRRHGRIPRQMAVGAGVCVKL